MGTITQRLGVLGVTALLGTGIAAPAADAATVLERISPDPFVYTLGVDWNVFFGSFPHDDVTAELAVPSGKSTGCSSDDFAAFPVGSIALIERQECSFSDKVLNAEDAGAVGAIIYNHTDGLLEVQLVDQVGILPVFTTRAVGQELLGYLDQGDVVMRMVVPLPAALPMFLTGLAGLGYAGWRKSRQAPQGEA